MRPSSSTCGPNPGTSTPHLNGTPSGATIGRGADRRGLKDPAFVSRSCAGLLFRRRHLDLRDRHGVVLRLAGHRHVVPRVRFEACEILIGDLVDLVSLANEHVLLAT